MLYQRAMLPCERGCCLQQLPAISSSVLVKSLGVKLEDINKTSSPPIVSRGKLTTPRRLWVPISLPTWVKEQSHVHSNFMDEYIESLSSDVAKAVQYFRLL